jgi:aspartate racemase
MKKIGMIGGLSFESTALYYNIINREMQKRLGGTTSAEILMYSFNFAEVEALQTAGRWDDLADIMVGWARVLKKAGADFIVICANTMHRMAPAIESRADINVLHIADVTGRAVKKQGLSKVLLLGTRYVMEGDFYTKILSGSYGLEVLIPNTEERDIIHGVIYGELIKGIVSDASRQKYQSIINRMIGEGAEGVILGCTEIPMLIGQQDVSVPVFNTTDVHALAAVDAALLDHAD